MSRPMELHSTDQIIEMLEEVIAGLGAGTTKFRSMKVTLGYDSPRKHELDIDIRAIVIHEKDTNP